MSNKFVVGQKVKVVANGSSHNQPMGTVLTVKSVASVKVKVEENTYWYALTDVVGVATTREVLEKQIASLQDKIADHQREIENVKVRIAYLTEVGEVNFDENEFKAYQTLRLLEQSDMTHLQRAKAIASLFN